VLEGVAEAWIDGRENEKVRLEKGDAVALPPNVPHSFRVVGDQVLKTLGTHALPKRIAVYTTVGPDGTSALLHSA
jgi:mannose-6-phosphate isomerase-like protein (cupin superfamily)